MIEMHRKLEARMDNDESFGKIYLTHEEPLHRQIVPAHVSIEGHFTSCCREKQNYCLRRCGGQFLQEGLELIA
eukprot:4692422-Amphidinium_carterae.1